MRVKNVVVTAGGLLICKLEFIQMLNAIRYGMLTDRYIQILGEECAVPVGYTDGIEPTQL